MSKYIFAALILSLILGAVYFDYKDRERWANNGSRYVDHIPKGSNVLSINGHYISYEYKNQCFLSYKAGNRNAALAKINC